MALVPVKKPARKVIQFSKKAKQASDANSVLLYGPSRAGKTRECACIVKYVWDKWGLKTRYITIDGGSYQPLQPYIQAGMVDVIDLTAAEGNIVPAVRGISAGLWLEDEQWVAPENQKTLKDVGCYIFESISGYSSAVIQSYIDNNVNASQDLVSYSTLINDDEELAAILGDQKVGKLSMSHYGLLADELTRFVQKFRGLQTTLNQKMIVFTSHEASSEVERVGMKVTSLGPSAEGQKFTSQLPRMVGDMFYLTPALNKQKILEYRAAFAPYPDPQLGNRLWPASIRGGAEITSKLLSQPEFKDGYLLLTDEEDPIFRLGITRLFRERDKIETEAAEKISALMALNSKDSKENS
jgi:hypothetical protein